MYPSTTKFQTRPASPQFPNISPPDDYPPSNGAMGSMGAHGPIGVHHHNHHHHNQIMQQQQQQQQQHQQHQHHQQQLQQQQQQLSQPLMMRHPSKTLCSSGKSRGPNIAMSQSASMSGSLGHQRGDLMFPDELDTIEFCMPPPPAPATNGMPHGMNGDMMLMHGSNGICSGIAEAFTERRRRGHSRRSNHKMDVEQQVKWSRKNIAATMERFEPTAHSSSSTSSLEYGFAAGVVTPSTTTTPLHQAPQPPQISPTHMSVYPSTSHGAVGGTMPNNHVYSYAYYEPGAAKCHTNVPHSSDAQLAAAVAAAAAAAAASGPSTSRPSKSPPRNSIRALLAKGFRSKSNSGQSSSSSPSNDERHTYTTRYGTTENLYEEVNEQKIRKVLSDNRIATSSVANVKEELRRVQHNHFRVLDELNLSLEALIMPPTPPDVSPNHGHHHDDDDDVSTTNNAAAAAAASGESLGPSAGVCLSASSSSSMSQRPRRGGLLGGASSSTSSTTSSQQRTLSHASLENLSSTLHSMELKDHAHSSCINPDFDEGDLDSGFSGSGSSSGASYNESLRYYKSAGGGGGVCVGGVGICHTGQSGINTTLPHNLRSCRSSTASGTSTSKSSMASADEQHMSMMASCSVAAATMGHNHHTGMSPFNFVRRCSDTQRGSSRSATTIGSAGSTATGTKPKKNFWTIKP